ncbi:MAG: VOC family protein, partial [Candidatus Dormibacteraeota bacterium]|nr:VOC family protein [Candidatus Dormibacteraeota bacterium]
MPFPTEGVELTHLLVVSDVERSRTFYRDVLGAAEFREYGGTSSVLQFQGNWLLLVTGGGPTQDKP